MGSIAVLFGHGPDHGPARAEARGAVEIGQHDGDVGPVFVGLDEQRREVRVAAALELDLARDRKRPGLNRSTLRTRSSPMISIRPASCRRVIASISLAKRSISSSSTEPETSTITASLGAALSMLNPGSKGRRRLVPHAPWLAI